MTFSSLKSAPVVRAREHLGGANALTLIVGAGVSRDAGLPDWGQLVERLLRRAADARSGLDEQGREDWIRQTVDREQYLGSAAVVAALRSSDELEEWISEEVYEGRGSAAWAPGPIAREIAYLVEAYDCQPGVLTLNYDDLLEQALADRFNKNVRTIGLEKHKPAAAGELCVTHLHGYTGRDGTFSPLVISEDQYSHMQHGQSWQERQMVEALNETSCLFIGTSLNDPNLVRYLYAHKIADSPQHVAVFVRPRALDDRSRRVRAFREQAVTERWKRCGVTAVFVDHYADVGQFVHEVGLERVRGGDYRTVEARTGAWIRDIERTVLRRNNDDRFRESQRLLSAYLRESLGDAVVAAQETGADLSEETLAVGLWLLTDEGTALTNWVTSDRAHQEVATIMPVPINERTDWVAIDTIMRGVPVEDERDIYASRWKYIRGLPLRVDADPVSGVLVGAITITSTKRRSESELDAMPDEVKSAFSGVLTEAVRAILSPASP